jgi:hypothetical protein
MQRMHDYDYEAEIIDKYFDYFQEKGWFEPFKIETTMGKQECKTITPDIKKMRHIFHKLAQRPNEDGYFFVEVLDILAKRNPSDKGYEKSCCNYPEIRGWFCSIILIEGRQDSDKRSGVKHSGVKQMFNKLYKESSNQSKNKRYTYSVELINEYFDKFQKKGWFEPYEKAIEIITIKYETVTPDIEKMRNIFHELAQRPNHMGSFFVALLDILEKRNPSDRGYILGDYCYFPEIRGWFCFLIKMENMFQPDERGNLVMMIDKLSREKITI